MPDIEDIQSIKAKSYVIQQTKQRIWKIKAT